MKSTDSMNDIDAEIARIMARPYRRELIPNEDGTWFARVAEFPGCMTEGDTPEEAFTALADAAREWLRVLLEDGDPIPSPLSTTTRFSGKFVVRVPTILHRELANFAARENVSLNSFVVSALSRAIGEVRSARGAH